MGELANEYLFFKYFLRHHNKKDYISAIAPVWYVSTSYLFDYSNNFEEDYQPKLMGKEFIKSLKRIHNKKYNIKKSIELFVY